MIRCVHGDARPFIGDARKRRFNLTPIWQEPKRTRLAPYNGLPEAKIRSVLATCEGD